MDTDAQVVQDGAKDDTVAERNSFLAPLLEQQDWLSALSQWHGQSGQPISRTGAQLGLDAERWQGLQDCLAPSGWFDSKGETWQPNAGGRELLYRVNELITLITLEAKGVTPTHLFEQPLKGAALEIGCGTGYVMRHMGRQGYAPIYGYDLSPTALDIARCLLEREGFEAKLYSRDATPLKEVADGEVAMIYSRGAVHYFEVPKLARSFKRVLMPGARVVVEVKSPIYYRAILRDLKRRRFRRAASYSIVLLRTLTFEFAGAQPKLGTSSHETAWSRRTIRRFGRIAGLKLESVEYVPSFKGYLFVMTKPETATGKSS